MSRLSAVKQVCAARLLIVGILACSAAASAQAPTGAAKSAAASSTQLVFGPFDGAAFNSSSFIQTPFQDVLVTSVNPPGGKDLFINVSMETGIFVSPLLQNLPGFALTAAQAGTQLQVRVLIDCADCAKPYVGRPAAPGTINFDNLFQSYLRVTNAGFDVEAEGSDQLGVRSFTFFARDVGVGVHTVRVQARFVASASVLSINGITLADVGARIGARTATVEEVKLDAQ
jgi:hypothetical protein